MVPYGRKSGTEHLKEKQKSKKKKNDSGLPQGVSNFTDTYLE